MRGSQFHLRTGWLVAICTAALAVAVAIVHPHIYGIAQESPAEVDAPIQLSADWSQEWTEGGTTIALFRGACRVVQGDQVYTSNSMVVWAHGRGTHRDQRSHVTVYLEDGVQIQSPNETRNEQTLWVDLASNQGLTLQVKGRVPNRVGKDDPLFRRAVDRTGGPTRTALRQTQLTVPAPVEINPNWRSVQVQQQAGLRRVRVSPRSIAMPFNIQSYMSNNTTPPEQVTLITGGVNVVVDGMTLNSPDGGGAIDLSADRVIIWTDADTEQFSPEMMQRPEQPFQLYLEGNIVIRRQSVLPQLGSAEINNTIRATRAFYDAREHRALILDAELQTYIPSRDVMFRLRAEQIRQDSLKSYHAQNAWFTTSEMGYPGYRIQSNDLYLDQRPTGGTAVDPATGQPVPREATWVTAAGTQLLIGDVPLFYAPQVSLPVEDPGGTPLVGLQFGQDRIFGTQVRTRWDTYALLGIPRPGGVDTRWNILLDYMSYRGPGIGTDGKYSGIDPWGNSYSGGGLKYYVHDNGVDNLGRDRQSLVPPDGPNRGIFEWNHTHLFAPYNMKLQTEVGMASDRNVRESFFERDFDTGKDLDVAAYLRQQPGESWTWSLLVQPTVNYFENNTAWLPRGDLNSLGVPLLGGTINWSQHTSLAYAKLNQATAPTNPQDTFSPLPYFTDANGMVTMTRHELDAPFNLGPLKVSPYVMGEAAYWSDSFTEESIDRYYGRGGVRASLEFFRAFPQIQSDILNLNGLAHKVILDADYGYAQASRSLSEIPQWNQFEDNAQERFRERFLTNTFGGTLPPQFDPRFYAVRSQAATSVSAPYNELVDSQQALRLGLSQRLQTKVGPPERQRIKDWMILDLGVSYFPNPNRDNFGQNFGLFSGHYVWNVGDRTTLLADSMYDFFDGGQQWWNIGVMSQRSFRGSVYVGVQQIKGATLDSQILTGSYSYTMSPKWVSTMSASYDIAQGQSRGQSLTITRVGEWMMFHLGANYDWSKNNAGFIFSIEPKLGRNNSQTQLGSLVNNPAQR